MNEDPHRTVAGAAGAVGQDNHHQSTAPSADSQSRFAHIDWALEYGRRGFLVFPLHSIRDGRCTCDRDCGKNAAKHPRVKGGFKVATTDPKQITDWWTRWPDANIGIATGRVSGIIVLDIDGREGLSLLNTLVAANGRLPRTPRVQTSRGWHLYFRLPASGIAIPCSAGGGLDVRGDGGYVVAPPSIHVSGHVYRWCDAMQIAEIPEWLCVELSCRLPANRAPLGEAGPLGPTPESFGSLPLASQARDLAGRVQRNLSGPDWSPAEEARLRSALATIPAVSRDDWLHVGMALHSTNWPNAFEIWDAWSRTCPEKYDEADQQRTWESFGRPRDGQSIGIGTIFRLAGERGWTDDRAQAANGADPEQAQPNDPPKDGSGGSAQMPRDLMMSAAALRLKTYEPVRFLLQGFIPEGLSLLVGRPKIGKSWWVLDVCVGCSANRTTLGTLLPAHGDVLYLALEDGWRRLQRRLNKLLGTFRGEWPERLKLVAMGGWRRADQGGLEKIEEWCKSASKPVLVVVDTLERFRKPANGKASLYSADYDAITGLQKIATDYGIAIIVLHHDRKSDADDAFDTISGTLGLPAGADTILIIKRRSNGVTLFARGRDIEESETAMQFDKETCRWTILGKASEVQRSNERARVIAALRASVQPLSTKEIMIEADMPNRNAADVLLSKMVRDGEIERAGRGRYRLPDEKAGKIGQKERNET